ncbi:hypothetical protein [Nonomuraea endophytica]|uniref:hypothetical protein n=1 Tax=Nonomuraea endophytica TaxID=714136 RepID=UPI0037CC1178
MRTGHVYERPTSAPPTSAGAGSAWPGLLPTPIARDGKGRGYPGQLPNTVTTMLTTPRATDGTKGGPNQRGSVGDLMLPSAVMRLLPTPRTSDTNGAGLHGDGGMDLRTAISLLPTPTAADSERTSTTYARGNPTLTGALTSTGGLTPRPSRAGKRPAATRHPDQLSLDGMAAPS